MKTIVIADTHETTWRAATRRELATLIAVLPTRFTVPTTAEAWGVGVQTARIRLGTAEGVALIVRAGNAAGKGRAVIYEQAA